MIRSRIHLEDVIDERDLKVRGKTISLSGLMCPNCSKKLDVRCFGASTEKHILSCSKCRIVWTLKKHQLLYKTKSLGVKGSKNFF